MENQNDKKVEQPELELEFENVEPITPKKMMKQDSSFFTKLQQQFHSAKSSSQHSENSQTETDNNATETEEKSRWKHPENWKVMQKLPPKHRRLVIALIVFILILLLFLWLKPSSKTVEYFQAQQNNSFPIEFQPIDPNALNETSDSSYTEGMSSGMAELPAYPQEKVAVETNNHVTNNTTNNKTNHSVLVQPPQLVEATPITTTTAPASKPVETTISTSFSEVKQTDVTKPSVVTDATPPIRQVQTRVNSVNSVKEIPQAKVTAPITAPIVEGRVQLTRPSVAMPRSSATKTLIIEKGVTLMQTFRNHHLNIADVNAMTKAPGGEKALSRFKPGDKVRIKQNANGRVTDLYLPNGGHFIRQANGTYQFKR